MNKYLLLYLFFFITIKNTYAQLSTLHYLPPIYEKKEAVGSFGEVSLFISTPSDASFYVKIYQGFEKEAIDSIKVSSSLSGIFHMGNSKGGGKLLGIITKASDLNTPLKTVGLRLEGEKPFFVNMRGHSKRQGFSLTSKGTAALGTSFRTGHMLQGNLYQGGIEKRLANFISVMATQNNTKIRFSNFKTGVEFYGLEYSNNAKTSRTSNDINVTLDQGESFVIAQHGDDFDKKDENKAFGILVTSSKPITVSVGSNLAASPLKSANYYKTSGFDVGLDQIVPITGVGKEYILMKGQGNNLLERPVIVATKDGTKLKINGSDSKNTLDAGETLVLDGKTFSNKGNLHLLSNHPIYVYQTTAGAEKGQTCGLNFVPPLNECASANYTYIPSTHYIGENAFLNIVAKTHTPIKIINAKTKKVLATLSSHTSNLDQHLTLEWASYKYHIPESVDDIAIKSDEAINVSMTVQSDAIGAAGYYSGFTPTPIIIPEGGKGAFYKNKELKLKLKQYEGFVSFKWYHNGTFLTETQQPQLMIYKTGTYTVAGIDKSCSDKEFMSSPFYLEELKEVEVTDVEDLFSEETHEELELAIKNDDISPILVNLNYVYNKAELVEESFPLLDNVIAILKKYENVRIQILAHTDCKGSDKYNLDLSQRRAEYVKNYMVSHGIKDSRLEAKGMGERSPLEFASCDCDKEKCSETTLALNRRSEFVIIKNE